MLKSTVIRTTGKIRVSIKNDDLIKFHLENIQRRCSTNLATYDELVEECAKADAQLKEKGMRKTGAILRGEFDFVEFNSRRPRSTDFTRYRLERSACGWFVTEISREKGWGRAKKWEVTLTPGKKHQKQQMAA